MSGSASGTVASLRAPAKQKREGHDPEDNPLLWRLLRYERLAGRGACSHLVRKFFWFGLVLSMFA
ncbi:hypothetical protein HZA57_04235, partial [Candidatus Poribacteria bacterium]|nr:hypothetical protein [Candidatus Poribacteria bacterium]